MRFCFAQERLDYSDFATGNVLHSFPESIEGCTDLNSIVQHHAVGNTPRVFDPFLLFRKRPFVGDPSGGKGKPVLKVVVLACKCDSGESHLQATCM